MVENHIILESKEVGNNCVIALPESIYHKGVDQIFDKVGSVSGLTSADFQEHKCWIFNYIPIQIAGSLKESPTVSKEAVKKGLETICNTHGLNFNQERLLRNPLIASLILDYEVVEGNIYIVRFSGRNLIRDNEPITRSVAYFVAPLDGEVVFDGTKLLINGNQANSQKDDLLHFMESNLYEGSIKAFKAGSASLHRKSLKPYVLRGENSGNYSNGPLMILKNDVEQKKLDYFARTMNFE